MASSKIISRLVINWSFRGILLHGKYREMEFHERSPSAIEQNKETTPPFHPKVPEVPASEAVG